MLYLKRSSGILVIFLQFSNLGAVSRFTQFFKSSSGISVILLQSVKLLTEVVLVDFLLNKFLGILLNMAEWYNTAKRSGSGA